MARARIITGWIFSVILAGALIYAGFIIYQRVNRIIRPAMDAVPESSCILFHFSDTRNSFDLLTNENSFFSGAFGIKSLESIYKSLLEIDTLLTKDQSISNILKNKTSYLAVIPDSNNSYAAVFLLEIPDVREAKSLMRFFKEQFKPRKIKSEDYPSVYVAGSEGSFYYILKDGILIGSFSLDGIKTVINQLAKGTPLTNNSDFQQLMKTSGVNVDANLYFRYDCLAGFLGFFAGINSEFTGSIGDFASWSALDLNINEKEVQAIGYTLTKTDGSSIFNRLADKDPISTNIMQLFPYNTEQILSIGGSQPVDIPKWIENESALALVKSPLSLNNTAFFILIKARENTAYSDSLRSLSVKGSLVKYKEFETGELKNPLFKDSIFSILPAGNNFIFYTSLKGFIVLASSSGDLKYFIEAYINKMTLEKNVVYNSLADNISDHSNLFFYLNISPAFERISEIFSPSIQTEIAKNRDKLIEYTGIAFQLARSENLYYTSLTIGFDSTLQDRGMSLWNVSPGSLITGKPMMLEAPLTCKKVILVSDDQNNLFMLDDWGNISWKINLAGPLLGEPKIIDADIKGDYRLIFNTAEYFYCIDTAGAETEGFPVNLEFRAGGGIVIADYGKKNHDYHYLIPSADGVIYNLDSKGSPEKGWKPQRLSSSIADEPQYLSNAVKEYFIFRDVTGNIRITDRSGKECIRVPSDRIIAKNSVVYFNRTNSKKGSLMTTDENGHLVYLSEKGNIQETIFGEFSPDHFFFYEDFNSNKDPDFIFLDNGKIVVFDRFKKILFSYDFGDGVTIKPSLLKQDDQKLMLMIKTDKSGSVYLLSDDSMFKLDHNLSAQEGIFAYIFRNEPWIYFLELAGKTLYYTPMFIH